MQLHWLWADNCIAKTIWSPIEKSFKKCSEAYSWIDSIGNELCEPYEEA